MYKLKTGKTMKKILSLVALATLFVGCNNEEFDSALNVYSLKGYADVESRTAFGSPTDNSIPFEWCAGDYVYVGNVQSNALTNGGSSATFTFGTTPTATDVYYNMTGSSATEAKVKSEQVVGDLGTNGDFGYGTISNGAFTLQHATAYVWFNATALPDGATLEKVTLNAGEAVIAGTTTWNGSSFGTVSNGSSTIELTVNKETISGAELAMVVLPTTISNATVTYQLKVGEKTKYYQQTLGEKTLTSGTTYKVTTDLSTVDLYELRVLTFEDGTEKFEPYECLFSYAMNYTEEYKRIENWSDYIPRDGQYGNGHGAYEWYDEGNTELAFVKPTIDSWWGISGHAGISDYVGTDEDLNQYHDDNMLFMIDLQAYNVQGGANGSKNFCSQYGYLDPDDYATQYSPEGVLPGIQFYDEVPRVIDYMYVTNTTYAYGVIINGECDFGGSYEYTDESTFKIVAYGYDSFDDTEPTMTEFYLLNTGKRIVTDWTKWDLSVLGKVVRVEFNLIACYQGYGSYGLVIPAYFAYDDVAVRFTETAE